MSDLKPSRLAVERIRRPGSGERGIEFCDLGRATIFLALGDGGKVDKTIEGRRAPSPAVRSAGAAIILPPNIKLAGITSGPVDFLRVSVDKLAVEEAAENARFQTAVELLPKFESYDQRIWRAGLLLVQELEHNRPGGQLFMDALSHFFAFHLLDSYSTRNRGEAAKTIPAVSFQLKRSLLYIRERLSEDISLDEIAAVSGMSPAHFSRQFRLAMGVSPWRYVLDCRLEEGKRLLETSNLTIKEVAKRVGFKGATAFITSYGRRYKIAPNAYRMSFKR